MNLASFASAIGNAGNLYLMVLKLCSEFELNYEVEREITKISQVISRWFPEPASRSSLDELSDIRWTY
ncbi:hypothetical protein RB195_017300 [Necator americanus]|uniref:Uncharacterized protein n=1 Tax=Necator americanus TaxID=51031 RepID=A0ABR1C883_NECAM